MGKEHISAAYLEAIATTMDHACQTCFEKRTEENSKAAQTKRKIVLAHTQRLQTKYEKVGWDISRMMLTYRKKCTTCWNNPPRLPEISATYTCGIRVRLQDSAGKPMR